MKINIELDLTPEEIPFAKEFVTLLHQLMSQYRGGQPKVDVTVKRDTLSQILRRIKDGKPPDQIANEINTLLPNPEAMQIELLFQELEPHFFDSSDSLETAERVIPCLAVIMRLNNTLRMALRERLISRLYAFLIIKRPVDAERIEFFSHAEIFAILIKAEFIDIKDAITTIMALAQKVETRCAAITMLGKTIEMCLTQIKERCDPGQLQELRVLLEKHVKEETFVYDLEYVRQNMRWDHQNGSDYNAAEKNRGMGPHLNCTNSMTGHSTVIFSVSYDEDRDTMVSSSKDGAIIIWKDGKQKEKLQMKKHYACSLDISSKNKVMYVCGVPKDSTTGNPAVIGFTMNDKGVWAQKSMMERSDAKRVTCVKALEHDTKKWFATGESPKAPNEKTKVRVYDPAAPGQSFQKLQPVVTYEEHDDLITSLANHSILPGLFFSASCDQTIKLWDAKVHKSVGSFGTPNAFGKITAHEQMVTCLDCQESILVSSSMDGKLGFWDIRKTDQPVMSLLNVDDSGIFKVALSSATHKVLAASTQKGLYLIDLTTGIATPATGAKGTMRYHDLRWTKGKDTLFAGGEDMTVDIFTLST